MYSAVNMTEVLDWSGRTVAAGSECGTCATIVDSETYIPMIYLLPLKLSRFVFTHCSAWSASVPWEWIEQ